ncbi:MAG: hypothetical protein NZ890_02660 [Myxococcota bacterium]|nr:hypothetical protein [Myxococcota bacterium]
MRIGLLGALLLHGALLVMAYLAPDHPPPPRRRVIDMEVIRRTPPPQEPPRVPQRELPVAPRAQRPLPSLLRPVPRPQGVQDEPDSPAAVLPEQPEPQPGDKPAMPKGPIDLFHRKSLSEAIGGPGVDAPIPKGPNRLFKDERLEEKKEAEFHLVPERGGGFKFNGPNFTAHIAADGTLTFKDKFPIGFQRGQTGFSFDLTDLAMRGQKQDPYAAEKRRFEEFSRPLREELRRKKRDGMLDMALNTLPAELAEIWQSSRPAAVRRRELFEKWVEAADDREGTDSQGQRARRLIEEFIRRHLPLGSPHAYTEEELRRFALMREGLPAFDPYRQGR